MFRTVGYFIPFPRGDDGRRKMNGLPRLAIAAFSRAIAATLPPRNAWWSRSTAPASHAHLENNDVRQGPLKYLKGCARQDFKVAGANLMCSIGLFDVRADCSVDIRGYGRVVDGDAVID